MKRMLLIGLLAASLAASLAMPPAATAGTESRDICICRQAIARTLCKNPSEVEYIDRFQDTANYSFTVFYAKKEERFICNVAGNEVRIRGNAWIALMRTINVTLDPDTNCATLSYSSPECPRGPVRCCAPKSQEDIQREKDTEFWSRPIPELLQEELRTGIASEPNATGTDAPPATKQ